MRLPTSEELAARRQRFADQQGRRDKGPWLGEVVVTVFWAVVVMSVAAMAWRAVF